MSAVEELRLKARAILTEGCFVRPDRSMRALFVTDYPARHRDTEEKRLRLSEAGFIVEQDGALWLLDLNDEAEAALEDRLPDLPMPPMTEKNAAMLSLCRMIMRHGGHDGEMLRRTLLRIEEGRAELLTEELNVMCAEKLRRHEQLSIGAARLMIMYLEEKKKC